MVVKLVEKLLNMQGLQKRLVQPLLTKQRHRDLKTIVRRILKREDKGYQQLASREAVHIS